MFVIIAIAVWVCALVIWWVCSNAFRHSDLDKLKSRLHRIRIPTLFLWGSHDRMLSEAYGRAYCAMIAGARFEPIDRAGHFPDHEQPKIFAEKVLAFAKAK